MSSKFFDTQVSTISSEELVIPCHACCVLSRLRCNGHSILLSSYLSRTGRIKNPSCSACRHPSQDTSHLTLHCPAMDFLVTFCLFTTSGPGPGELLSFWGSKDFHYAPIPWKESGNNSVLLKTSQQVTMWVLQKLLLVEKDFDYMRLAISNEEAFDIYQPHQAKKWRKLLH